MNKLAEDINNAVNYKLAMYNFQMSKTAGLSGAFMGGLSGALGGGAIGALHGGLLGACVGGIRGLIQKHNAMKNRNFIHRLFNMEAGPSVWDTIKHDAGIGAGVSGGIHALLHGSTGAVNGSWLENVGNSAWGQNNKLNTARKIEDNLTRKKMHNSSNSIKTTIDAAN